MGKVVDHNVDALYGNILTEIKDKVFNSDEGTPLRNRVVFLVGAGVSKEEPSSVPAFPQDECLQELPDLHGTDETLEKLKHHIRPEFFFQILYNQLGVRGLMPLDVLNTRKLNDNGASIQPNVIHDHPLHSITSTYPPSPAKGSYHSGESEKEPGKMYRILWSHISKYFIKIPRQNNFTP